MDVLGNGFLEIIYGPMKSGKTSRLLQLYKQFKFCGVPVMVINNSKDNRYSETYLSTHDKVMIPCIKSNNLSEIINLTDIDSETISTEYVREFTEASVILINEAQFFDDIVEWVTIAVEKYKKNVYICGLNSDFKRKPFGNWLDLEQICDRVTHLHSWCSICKKNPALFSHRLTNETEKIIIGSENYIPVCRTCWLTVNI